MSVTKKLLEASGGGGGESTYVDDCFANAVFTGTGAYHEVKTGVPMGNTGYGTSTRFDGVADGSVRTSDLTGNSNGKQFTFSVWVRPEAGADGVIYAVIDGSSTEFGVSYDSGNARFSIWANGGSTFSWQTWNGYCPPGRWYHLLVSADLTDPTNKRHIYVDELGYLAQYNTTNNLTIEFSHPDHRVGRGENQYQFLDASLAHLYLDYTYRDLSVESNRRLFSDGAGSSVSSSSLTAMSPILYLPMADGDATTNEGTGGDFTTEGSPSLSNTGVEAGEGKGGLIWTKSRSVSYKHSIQDTVRGSGHYLWANETGIEEVYTANLKFLANGFATDGGGYADNFTGRDYVAWSFAKQEGFFDIVTYTGNGTNGRQIPHNLGSTPGMVICKAVDGISTWAVKHRSSPTNEGQLNSTGAFAGYGNFPASYSGFTNSVFTVDSGGSTNANGTEYVAYVFAHDAQEFGPNGDESIIKCGSYEGNGSTNGPEIDLGWEPQWLLIKDADGANNWIVQDVMRGIATDGNDPYLQPNNGDAESGNFDSVDVNATGFKIKTSAGMFNDPGKTHIYMAIRRPNKPAEEFEPDELFAVESGNTLGTSPKFVSGFPVDMTFFRNPYTTNFTAVESRLTGAVYLKTNDAAAETNDPSGTFDYQNGHYSYFSSSAYLSWMFKRAPGFFDVVAYAGVDADAANPHGLGVVPEMVWIKRRNFGTNWFCWHSALPYTKAMSLENHYGANTHGGNMFTAEPTDETFTTGYGGGSGGSGGEFIAFLWASVPGICDIGSYTGTGADLNVDCGFTNGSRFVLIKRTDYEGGWYYWDTLRGIVTGDDPYLLFNSTAAQVTNTDYIDPLASGFTVTASAPADLNASGGEYIYMAIA